MDADLIIIGAGPAGYVAAIRASQMGARVMLVEERELGGTCLNVGCIPTKALVKGARLLYLARKMIEFGIEVSEPRVDFKKFMSRKGKVVGQLVAGLHHLLSKNGVEVLRGRATLLGSDSVGVWQPGGQLRRLKSKKLVLATGSRPVNLPALPVDGRVVVDSDGLLQQETVPSHLVIVGGGVVGVEFATVFRALGSEVTVIEMLPQLLPGEDEEVAAELTKHMTSRGIKVLLGAKVEKGRPRPGGVELEVHAPQGTSTLSADRVLVAVGRRANTSDLGLETVGVEVQKRFIVVDNTLRTNIPSLYAAGDVVGRYKLAHTAFEEGLVAAENALGSSRSVDYSCVPRCIFSFPEVAAVGLTEKQARASLEKVVVSRFPFRASGKALADGEADGYVKLVAEPAYGQVVGAAIIGPTASELIVPIMYAIRLEATLDAIVDIMHPHPSLSEAIKEAALIGLGHPLHFS